MLILGLFLVSCSKENSISSDVVETTFDIESLFEEIEDFDEANQDFSRNSRSISYKTLNAALICTGLKNVIIDGGLTVFLPTDNAFAALGLDAENICEAFSKEDLVNILSYHVVEGAMRNLQTGCMLPLNGNPIQITAKDIRRINRIYVNESRILRRAGCSHSIYYTVDQVLLPPELDIVGVASSENDFSILVDAVLAADPVVAETLTDPDNNYTVFAPDNSAFADLLSLLGVGSLDDLIDAVGISGLTTVLTYHVVEGCVFSNDLEDGVEVTTLQGEKLIVDLKALQLQDKTGSPKDLGPLLDVRATNGVIHQIGGVLLPQAIIDNL